MHDIPQGTLEELEGVLAHGFVGRRLPFLSTVDSLIIIEDVMTSRDSIFGFTIEDTQRLLHLLSALKGLDKLTSRNIMLLKYGIK